MLVDRRPGDLEAPLREVLGGVAHRVMLDRTDDQPAAARLARPRGALDGEVVRLGAARCQDDLAGRPAEIRGQLLARLVEGVARGAAQRVGGRGVPEGAAEIRKHRLEGLGAERGGRRVVQVDRGGWHQAAIVRPTPRTTRRRYPLPS